MTRSAGSDLSVRRSDPGASGSESVSGRASMIPTEHLPISNVARTPSLHPRALDHLRVPEVGAESLNVGDRHPERLRGGGRSRGIFRRSRMRPVPPRAFSYQ